MIGLIIAVSSLLVICVVQGVQIYSLGKELDSIKSHVGMLTRWTLDYAFREGTNENV